MSLKFVFGCSGAGKSYALYQQIIEDSMAHPEQNYIVLVPEQFTLQTQKELVRMHPRGGIWNIDVLSFARLAYRVLEETGEGGRILLDDEGKNLILRKIAGESEDELRVLRGNMKKLGYIGEVKSVLSELEQYGIEPEGMEELFAAAEKTPALTMKLADLQLLYRRFAEFLEGRYVTKEGILGVLAGCVGRSKTIRDCTIVLDGYTGFTPLQNRVIREFMKYTRKVWVSLTLDPEIDPYAKRDAYGLFAMSTKTVEQLVRIAKEEEIEIEEEMRLPSPPYRFRGNPELAFLEAKLFRARGESYSGNCGNISMSCAKEPKEEAAYAASRIRELVRNGYRYKEIAVIAADMETYAGEIRKAFGAYGIPVFIDQKRNVLLNAFVEHVRSLLALAKQDFSRDAVIRFLRSGFLGVGEDEIDSLENYLIASGIRGYSKWNAPWTFRSGKMTEDEAAAAERLRVLVVAKLDAFLMVVKKRKKTVREITEAFCILFEQENIEEQLRLLAQRFQEEGELALAKEYEQIYRAVIDLFDRFVSLLGEETVSVREYMDLLDAGLSEARIGVIPPSLDEVMTGDLERSRLKDIKVLFLLGANDAWIPGNASGGGLLSQRDRDRFGAAGIDLAPTAKEKAQIQKFYLYLQLTKPTEQLYISYSNVNSDGKSLRPAYLVNEIRKLFPEINVCAVSELPMTAWQLNPELGMERMIEGLKGDERLADPAWQELYRWYLRSGEFRETAERLVDASCFEGTKEQLETKTAEKLYTYSKISISQMEKFLSCEFAHFLTYGLKLRERTVYEFEAADFGNVFHGAMEQVARSIADSGEDFMGLSDERVRELSEAAVEKCASNYQVLFSTARNQAVIGRIKRLVTRSVWAMKRQLSRGEFRPDGCELDFGSGKIDRVDICEDPENVYVKIVDYKTGDKAFDMTAFYYGLQTQLVIYMGEAIEIYRRRNPGKNVSPAGLFYYRMKDPLVEKEIDAEKLEKAILHELKLDGIVSEDMAVILKLDREFDGKSDVIPVATAKGGFAKSSRTVSPEDFENVIEYAKDLRTEAAERIRGGAADRTPYEMGDENSCKYCSFRGVCGFDEHIKAYEYRQLVKMERDEVLALIREKRGGDSHGMDTGAGESDQS